MVNKVNLRYPTTISVRKLANYQEWYQNRVLIDSTTYLT